MMMNKRVAVMFVMGCAVLALTPGCRKKHVGNNGKPDSDLIGAGGVSGDIPMSGDPSARFTEANRVMDADAQFEPIHFSYDGAQVEAADAQKVTKVADYMRRNSHYAVLIDGHCDERGSAEYNQSLGERRAQAVRAYLVGLGIPAASINTRSFGEEKPVDAGHNEASWQKNRRAEFGIYR